MRKGIDKPLWVTIQPLHEWHGQGPQVSVQLIYQEPGGDGILREESEESVYPTLDKAISEATAILRENWPNA